MKDISSRIHSGVRRGSYPRSTRIWDLEPFLTGSAQPKLNQATLNSIKVPVPLKEDMEHIVDKIEEEIVTIEVNSKLMSNLTQKIQDRISKVWGE